MKIRLLPNRLTASFVIALGASGLVQTAYSAVTVSFEQVGGDVKVSWSGTLNMPSNITVTTTRAIGANVGGGSNFSYFLNHSFGSVGSFENTGLPNTVAVRQPTTDGSWGFNGSSFIWDASIVSIGTEAVPQQLSFDPAEQFLHLESTTLAALGANSFDNTLAWTASTGDTISYTTVFPVPEPSSQFLIGMAAMGIAARRRR